MGRLAGPEGLGLQPCRLGARPGFSKRLEHGVVEPDRVVSHPEIQDPVGTAAGSCGEREGVLSGAPEKHVVARAAEQNVVSRAATEGVAARTAIEPVIPGLAIELVVAGAAIQPI